MIPALVLLAAAQTITPPPVIDRFPDRDPLTDAQAIAANGTLSVLLPMIAAKETDDLVAAHPELSAADKDALRATARQTADAGIARLREAEAQALVAALSPVDLATLAAAAHSQAAQRYRAAMPKIVAATAAVAGDMDFEKDVLAAFCMRTDKLCRR